MYNDMKKYLRESIVYHFKVKFCTFNKETFKSKLHSHSGLIIARTTKEAYDKLYESFSDVYSNETDEPKERFDFIKISIKEYCDFYSDDLIIYDKEDEYFGV